MKTTAVVPAAGKGNRLGTNIDKVFVLLDKRPILFHTIRALEKSKLIDEIILVVGRSYLTYVRDKFIRKFKFKKIKEVVAGGKTRTESVWNALKIVNNDTDLILIHDGARPFIDEHSINRVIIAAKRHGAAVLVTPINSTVKKVKNHLVKKTVERDFLYETQTPQVFKKKWLLGAYKRIFKKGLFLTDDALALERCGRKVMTVEGNCFNIKITRPQDLILAKAILKICG